MINYFIWQSFINEDVLVNELNKTIKESWILSKKNNVQYDGKFTDDRLEDGLLCKLIDKNKLYLNIICKFIKKIEKELVDNKLALFLVNNDGILLKKSSSYQSEINKELGLVEGSFWQIEKRGTTATGIALKYKAVSTLRNCEHYQNRYHKMTSIALPIFNIKKQLIYVMTLLINEETKNRDLENKFMKMILDIEAEIFDLEYNQKIHKLKEDINRKNDLYQIQANLNNYIFNNVSDMVFIMDEDRNFIKVNQPANQLLLKSGGAKNLNDIYRNVNITDFNGDKLSLEKDPVNMVFNGHGSINAEVCIHFQDNKKEYYHMDTMPFKDDEGRNLAIGILKDITDYLYVRDIKNKYKKKAEELENIINTISDGVAILNNKGDYVLLNPGCNEIFEYEDKIMPSEFKVGMVLKYANVTEVDGTPLANGDFPVNQVLQGKSIRNKLYRLEIKEKTKYIAFSGIPVVNLEGKLEYVVISFSDVTQIQRQKNLISQQKQFIQSIIEGLGIPVATVSYPDCRFELINEGFSLFLQQLLGIKLNKNELIGKTFLDTLPRQYAEEFMSDVIEVAAGNKTTEPKIVEYRDLNGGERHYQIVHSPTINDEGEIIYITAVGIEVTEEVKAKRESEALAKMKEEYFTVISHELRSPIAVVHSAIQMLNSDIYSKEFSGGTEKMLSRIEKNTNRLLNLVNNFLDITKAEAGYLNINYSDVAIFSFSETLLESLQPAAMKKSIKLHIINQTSTEIIKMDYEKYERILLNLLTNAIKFTDMNGEVRLFLLEDDNYFIIKVKDNGVGIPKEKIDKIFDRFYIIDGSFSRSNIGTGIGLSLVKKLVEVLKGRIEVESEEGVGSEFTVYFPK